MRHKRLFLASIGLFVLSTLVMFISIFSIYDLAGESLNNEQAVQAAEASLGKTSLVITAARVGWFVSIVLFVVWLLLVLRGASKPDDRT